MQRIYHFISNRDNAYIILVLSAYQNILSKSANLYKGNFDNDDFEFSYYIFTDLVYSFFLDYYDLSEKDFDYETFEEIFERQILREEDWNTIDNFSDFFLFNDVNGENQRFLGHTFNFQKMNKSLQISDCECVFENLWLFGFENFREANFWVNYYTIKRIMQENYSAKYKIVWKFKKKKLSIEKLCEYWSKILNKVTFKILKKRKIKKLIGDNVLLYWYFYSSILLVLCDEWINLFCPARAEELRCYIENCRLRALLCYAMMT